MNSYNVYFCKDCKKSTSVPLVLLPNIKLTCGICNSANLELVGENNPNDPGAREKEAEIVATLVARGWVHPTVQKHIPIDDLLPIHEHGRSK